MDIHLKAVGILLVLLALVHIALPRYFRWENEFISVSLITKQRFYVHTFFIAFVVLLMGLLCLVCASELLTTNLGKVLCIGLFLFWVTRLAFQFFVYSRKVWMGKRFETTMHILFSCLWTYFSTIFFLAIQFNNG